MEDGKEQRIHKEHTLHHPHFAKWTKRYNSFRIKQWPSALRQTARAMSHAGFFYTGNGDKVKCFSCGLTISDWQPHENPRTEHARHASHCSYLKQISSQGPGHLDSDENCPIEDVDHSCSICWSRKYDTVFVPCGHATVCLSCSSNVTVCPICQRKFSQIIKLYLT